MKVISIKNIIINSFYIFWATFTIILFTFYSGTISHLYDSSFANWHKFMPKLLQIDLFIYTRELLVSLTGVLFFTTACISTGSIFINKYDTLGKKVLSNWSSAFVTAFLLGEIVFSYILIGISTLAKLTPINTITIILLGSGIGALSFKNLIQKYTKQKCISNNTSKFEKLFFFLSILILASTMLFTTARISYDSTAFYFSNSKLIAATNRLVFFPNDGFVVSSFHIGIVYTALIQAVGDQAARFLSWINGLFIIFISIALADEMGLSRRAKLITLGLLITSTAFMDPFGDGKIEIPTTLFVLTSIYWLITAEKGMHQKHYLFAGIFAGFSIISRPYNLILLGSFIALLFIVNKTPLPLRVKFYITLSAPILIMLAFHLTINWLILGDFLAPLHNTSKVNPEIWQWAGFDPKNIWIARIFFPFVATFLNTPQSMGNISPIILTFLPIFFTGKTRSRLSLSKYLIKISLISLLILTTWIMVYFTILEIRYVFFLWIIIYISTAAIIDSGLETLEPFIQKMFSGIIVLLLLYMCVRNLFIAVDAYAPINENGVPQCNDSLFCSYLLPLNQNAAPGERVLGLSAFRYYFRPDLFACSSKADDYLMIQNALGESDEAFWAEVYNQGYAYIAYEENYSTRHLNVDFLHTISRTPDWIKLKKLSETFGGYFSTYRIEYINPPNQVSKKCVSDNGTWLVQETP